MVISYLLAMLPPFLANQAADQALSNIEIAKLGKAATGYVYAGQRWPIGAAFCVDRSGLFLTADCVSPKTHDLSRLLWSSTQEGRTHTG